MAALALPFTVIDGILTSLLEEGTHESLHAIVDIAMNGVMGAVNRATMRGAITAAKHGRMKNIYTKGHYAHRRAVVVAVALAVAPGAPLPAAVPLVNAPLHPAEFTLICKCTQCFAFLCRFKGGIITINGFNEKRTSYLHEALSGNDVHSPGVDVAVGIIQRLPDANLKLFQRWQAGLDPWPRNGGIFGICASRARPMKEYMKRIHALHLAAPPANVPNYSVYLDWIQTARMFPWIDVPTATRLRSWNINIHNPINASLGNVFHRVIVLRNPNRHTLLPWLDNYIIPGGRVHVNYINNTSLNPAGGPGWAWPPLGCALYMGDVVSVRALAQIPGIDLNPVTPVPGAAAITVGVAGPYALTWNALTAFKEWLLHANPLMMTATETGHVTDMLYATIKTCSDKRLAISAEPLPAGVLINAHKKSKARRRQMALDVALAFIYTIQEECFSTVRVEPNGTLTSVKCHELDWYRDWVAGFKRANRVAATRTCRDVIPLIDVLDRTTHRNTRSGRNQ